MNCRLANVRLTRLVIALAFVCSASLVSACGQALPPDEHHDSSQRDAVIARLIADLGANAYQTRTRATNELIRQGPSAVSSLARAANSDDLETATRAQQLLKVFNRLFFVGVTIELQPSRHRIAWNEPFSLIVRFTNRGEFPAHLPIEIPVSRSPGPHVRQVAAALDLADFLTVVASGSDQPIQCHVDDINLDDDVFEAVVTRTDNPPVTNLPSGKTVVHRIDSFNRGWARYKLLSEGSYEIQLVYQPDWSEDELNRAGVGRVVSNVATVVVTKGAPPEIRNATAPTKLSLAIIDGRAVASLKNLSDLPVTVNLNLSADRSTPMASVRWFLETGGVHRELPYSPPGEAGSKFTRQRLAELLPGQAVVLERLEIDSVLRLIAESHVGGGTTPELFARYTNFAGIVWQRDHAPRLLDNPTTPKALRSPLPRNLVTTTLSSNRISVTP